MSYEIKECECLIQTYRAILVESPAFDRPTWVPQSQVDVFVKNILKGLGVGVKNA